MELPWLCLSMSMSIDYLYSFPHLQRCRMCAVTFFSKSDMQIHAKSHTEAKPHKCPHCSKSFANSSYLSQHIRIHSGAKPYTCTYCQKTFRQLSHLQQHTRYWAKRVCMVLWVCVSLIVLFLLLNFLQPFNPCISNVIQRLYEDRTLILGLHLRPWSLWACIEFLQSSLVSGKDSCGWRITLESAKHAWCINVNNCSKLNSILQHSFNPTSLRSLDLKSSQNTWVPV